MANVISRGESLPMSNLEGDELAKACAASMWSTDHATQHLNMNLEEVREGYARISMKVSGIMINGQGNAHGGYIFTLADSTFAFACNSRNQISVAQHCTISYLAPGREDDVLTAEAVERAHAGRSGLYDVTVRNQNGVAIAEFRGASRTVKGQHLPDTE